MSGWKMRRAIAVLSSLAIVACASSQELGPVDERGRRAAAASAGPPPPEAPDIECHPLRYNFAYLATDTQIHRQGATVRITPTLDQMPFGAHVLPARCVSGWSVSGPATLSADRTSLTIAPDAPVGSVVRVSFVHADKTAAAEFRVIGRDEVVLTGRYTQKSLTGCQASEPVRELEFSPGNRFAVTFVPFETYQDYWGSYTFDPATGQLRLTLEKGNFVPPGLDLEGEARLEAGRLILRGLYLGSRDGRAQRDCTYSF